MDIFVPQFLEALRNVAVFVGLAYTPILFINGLMDLVIKFRAIRRDE